MEAYMDNNIGLHDMSADFGYYGEVNRLWIK